MPVRDSTTTCHLPRNASRLLTQILIALFAVRADAKLPSCIQDADCAALVDRALEMSRAEQYATALQLYQQAYARVPDPGLLANQGRMQQRLGLLKQAAASYHLYLSLPPHGSDAEHRRKAAEWLVETQQALQHTAAVPTTASLPSPPPPPGKAEKRPWLWITVGSLVAAGAMLTVGLAVGLTGRARSSADYELRF